MMNLDTWKKFNESIAGSMTLGVSKPHTVGGLMGLHQEWDDEDEDEEDDEDGDEDGKEGDLIGSSDEDEGPDKNFPPENSEDEEMPFGDNEDPTAGGEEFGEPEDDDFLASIGSGAGGKELGGAGGFGGAEGGFEDGGSDDDFMASLHQGGEGEDQPVPSDGNMDFLNDIDPEMAGFGPEDGAMGGDEMGAHGEPCPDCNPDGSEDHGDPDCASCNGEGFFGDDMGGDDLGAMGDDASFGDDLGGMEDEMGGDLDASVEEDPAHGDHPDEMKAYMNKMLSYMKKYMKKESTQFSEFAPAIAAAAGRMAPAAAGAMGGGGGAAAGGMMGRMAANPMMQQMAGQAAQGAGAQAVNNMMQPPQQQQQQMMKKKMVKFMSKGGERSFMAADAPRKFMKKDADKKHCACETTEFLDSLCSSAKGNNCKNSNGITEDSLLKAIDPTYESEPQAGEFGFSPQGRVGGIGGGYTKDDFKDIPVLGESRRYPTLAEYTAHKYKNAKRRK